MGHNADLGSEDRLCWMTVGTVYLFKPSHYRSPDFFKAIRLGYLIGLEQLAIDAEDADEKLVDDRDRAKVAWSCTYTLHDINNGVLTSLVASRLLLS